jgi:hypothetical protein
MKTKETKTQKKNNNPPPAEIISSITFAAAAKSFFSAKCFALLCKCPSFSACILTDSASCQKKRLNLEIQVKVLLNQTLPETPLRLMAAS